MPEKPPIAALREREIAVINLGFFRDGKELKLSIGEDEKAAQISTEAEPTTAAQYSFKISFMYEGERVEVLHNAPSFHDFINAIFFFTLLLK